MTSGTIISLALGYLLGAIPFGLILTRLAGLGDIRSVGSGNIGATNVLRTGRKDIAAATLLLDALKGTLAVVIGCRSPRSSPASPRRSCSWFSACRMSLCSPQFLRCLPGSSTAPT